MSDKEVDVLNECLYEDQRVHNHLWRGFKGLKYGSTFGDLRHYFGNNNRLETYMHWYYTWMIKDWGTKGWDGWKSLIDLMMRIIRKTVIAWKYSECEKLGLLEGEYPENSVEKRGYNIEDFYSETKLEVYAYIRTTGKIKENKGK